MLKQFKKYTEITMSGNRHIYIRLSDVSYVYQNGEKVVMNVKTATVNVAESLAEVLEDIGYEEKKETTGRSDVTSEGNQGTEITQSSASETNQKARKRRK